MAGDAGVGQEKKPTIYEIRVRRVAELTPEAQQEVMIKLKTQSETFKAKYKGFAKVTYATASPLAIISVDPIEGMGITFFKAISETITQ